MAKKVDEYLELTRDGLPILKECCLMNGWDIDEFQREMTKNAALKRAVNRLMMQREVNLEKGGILGSYNRSMTARLLREIYRVKEIFHEYGSLEQLNLTLLGDIKEADAEFDEDG
jgi:phage host-nuclease inhibitor protein Gam